MINNTQKNISNFTIWFLPIIIAAKIVRHTVMVAQLVWMSMGIQMIIRMNKGDITPFHSSLFSDTSNAGSVIMSNSEALFSAINVFGITTHIGWEIFFSIVFDIVFYYIIRKYYEEHPYASTRENIFIYLNLAILNVFCLNMSKEPLQLISFLLMYAALKNIKGYRPKCIALAVVLVLCVMYCRKYFGLVLMYFFMVQILVNRWFTDVDIETKQGRKLLGKRILMVFIIFGVFHFFFLSALAENSEDTYDEMVAANTRSGTGAVSEITPIFGGNRVMLAVDYFIKIFRLMFPIELLLKGKVTYIFLIVYQALLALFIVRAFGQRGKPAEEDMIYEEDEEEEQEEEDPIANAVQLEEVSEQEETDVEECIQEQSDSETDSNENEEDVDEEAEADEDEEYEYYESRDQIETRTAALYLYIAFLLCSAAFEPDFGSWTRHQGVAFPIILLML